MHPAGQPTAEAGANTQLRKGGDSVMPTIDPRTSRRELLKFLAASPLYASSTLAALAAETPSRLPDPMIWAPRDLDRLIASPKEAINIFDFEPVMNKKVPPGHFGYMASGIDDEVTLRA